MIEIAGTPVLLWNLRWLREQGVTEVVINLHYRPQVVTDYFGDGRRFGVNIQYSFEPEILGTSGAVRHAAAHLGSGTFAVVYADNVVHCDLESMRRLHAAVGARLTVALFWREDVRSSGVATIDEDGRVRGFVEKPASSDSHWVNAGLYLCEREVLDYIPHPGASDFGRDMLPRLVSEGKVQGYRMGPTEQLYWIDTPEDLARTRRALEQDTP